MCSSLQRSLTVLTAVLFLSATSNTYAQQQDNSIQSIEKNKTDGTPVSILFAPSANWDPGNSQGLFDRYLGVDGVNTTMRQQYSTTNKTGVTAIRYYEYYKGVRVEFGSYSLSCKDGRVNFMTGNYYNINYSPANTPAISADQAFSKALAYVGADQYMWQDPNSEKHIKFLYRKDTSYLPQAQMTWIEDYNSEVNDRKLHLAYSFDIYAKKPLSRQKVFVDAVTGAILFSNQLIRHTAASGHSMYSGVVPFQTANHLSTYYLYDSTRGNGVYTMSMNNGTDYSAATDYTSVSNTWPTSSSDSQALDSHWGAEIVYDYWLSQQGRHSWDDLDGILLNYVHYDVSYDNAFWDGAEMTYGDGSGCGSGGFTPLVSLDVTAHEIGHGVCQATCNLIYSKESGGIDEGFSDCWGATIENYGNPHEVDAVAKSTWEMGEEIGCGNPLRRIDFPKLKHLPDTYLGTYWYSVTSCTPSGGNDECGVHTNMGVISKWYYLITNGGSGTNDLSNSYSITGLGFTESQNILYQTELVLANNADYPTLRTTAINTAITLYGNCSNEVKVVTNAWYAVGVGAAYVNTPAAITGTLNVCAGGSTTLLHDATAGGSWSVSGTSASIVGSGTTATVTGGSPAGTAIVSYSLGGYCYATANVTVNAIPNVYAITGGGAYCAGSAGVHIGLASSDVGVTYQLLYFGSPVGSPVSGIGSSIDLGLVSAVGSGAYTVLATEASGGCTQTMSGSATVIVDPLPNSTYAVTGGGSYCSGGSGVLVGLSNSDLGVNYQLYDNGSVASTPIGGGSGSINFGPETIAGSYTVIATNASTTCSVNMTGSAIVIIDPLPATISGTLAFCTGTTSTLTDVTTPGTWGSSSSSIASVDGTGDVTGNSVGTAFISYTSTTTGCYTTAEVTVTPFPSTITGVTSICNGAATTLHNTVLGGTWSSSNLAVGTIDAVLGTLSGAGPGTTTVTYSLGSGCSVNTIVTVNTVPVAISGTGAICVSSTLSLSDGTSGGSWSSGATSIATVDGSGHVTGVSSGIASIDYTLSSGCGVSTVVTVNSATVAPISGGSTVCNGQTLSLSDATPGGSWSSSDVSHLSVTTGGVAAGLAAGSADITYSVTTSCGTAMSILPVTIEPEPTVPAIGGITSVCSGGTTLLTDATGGGAWSSASTVIATVSASGMVSGLATGSSLISYTLTNSYGCTASATTPVTVFAPFTVALSTSGSTSFCTGGYVVLSNTGSGSGITGYQWQVGGVNIPGATSNIYTASSTGNYALVVTGSGGCFAVSTPVAVTESSSPIVIPAVVISASPGTTICSASTPVTYTALPVNGGSSPSMSWFVNGSFVAVGNTYSYTPASGDIVTCDLTSSAACAFPTTADNRVTMTISGMETPLVSVAANPGFTVCSELTDTLTALPTYGGTTPSYVWSRNGYNVATGPKYYTTFANGDIVVCKMTSDFPCITTSTATSPTYVMHVDAPESNTVTIHVSQSTIIHGQVDSFVAVAPNGGSSPYYQWLDNGIAIPGANSSIYVTTTLNPGDIISCRVTSSDVCATPNTNTSGGIRVNVITTGVATVSAGNETFSVIPNPNRGSFTISGTLQTTIDEDVQLSITDMLGRQVWTGNARTNNGAVDKHIDMPSSIADGTYLISVTSGTTHEVFHVIISR